MSKSPITTHILDLGSGKPAAGVRVTLEQQQGDSWATLASAETDADGRVLNGFGSDACRSGIVNAARAVAVCANFFRREPLVNERGQVFHLLLLFRSVEP